MNKLSHNLVTSWPLRVAIALPVRWLRWLAVAQQKEYRFDRWWLHLRSVEGSRDFWQLVPTTAELTRTGLKRPVRTPRLYLLAVASLVLSLLTALSLYLGASWMLSLATAHQVLLVVISALITVLSLQLLLPVLILVASGPLGIISWWLTRQTEQRAAQLLAQHKPFVVGITGSYGKSSTKHLLGHVLAQHGSVFITPKSYNTSYSIARSLLQLYQGEPLVVVEYGAYMPGEIARVAAWLPPTLGVITGFAPQHLGLFGSEEAIIQAKSEMVMALPTPKKVIINGKNPCTKRIAIAGGAANVIDATGPAAREVLHHCDLTSQGVLSFVWRGHTVTTRLLGRHYQEVVSVVIAVALELGLTEHEIVTGLSTFVPSSGFIRLLPAHNHSFVVDDGGTSNPAGFAAILELAKHYQAQGKRVTLITAGIIDLGSESDSIHAKLAQLAKPVVDQVLYLSQIGYDQFLEAGIPAVRVFGHETKAWQSLVNQLSAQDLVLIEGKVPSWIYQQLVSATTETESTNP